MNELFGLPITTLAIILGSLLGVSVFTVVGVGFTNRTMFKFGLRNIPRRGLQSLLVIVGLALGTLITTAAFVTGDTIDQSLTADTYQLFGHNDLDITWNGERIFFRDAGVPVVGEAPYANGAAVDALESEFQSDRDIDAFLPYLTIPAPVTNLRTADAKPSVQLTGVDFERLARAGGLTLTDGESANPSMLGPDGVFLNEQAAEDLQAKVGDTLTVTSKGEDVTVRVVGILRNELSSGNYGMSFSSVPGGLVLPIERLREMNGLTNNEISSLTVALHGDRAEVEALADPVAERIQAYLDNDGSALFASAVAQTGTPTELFTMKKDALEISELQGNLFTTFFLVLGLFSMAAGVMLIFMIFVMLAAERRAEMGMARAVGAQRGHLVRSFLVEGMAYSLLAGIIGVGAGVLSSWLLVDVLLKAVGGDYFSLVSMEIRPTALVIGYSLGVVLTFVTVIFASLKASHVNIVAAIRQLPDASKRESRRKTRWGWVIAGVPAMVVPPLGIWFFFRKGLGLPWGWLVGPIGVLFGGLFMLTGKSSEVLFFFSLGISLVPLSLAAIARQLRVPNRPLWTVVGAVLAGYWLMPASVHERLFGKFNSDIEMFVISGVMIVIAFTLMIVFNARLLTSLFNNTGEGSRAYMVAVLTGLAAVGLGITGFAIRDTGDGLGELVYLAAGLLVPVALTAAAAARFPALAPALKMAIAYPLANRFRTGMTIAMFSLIVFSLTVFSVLLANFDAAFLGGDAKANMDVVTTASGTSTVRDVPAALAEAGSPVASDIAGAGRTTLADSAQLVSQPGEDNDGIYPVIGADDGFFSSLGTTLDAYANGYDSEAAVMEAVRTNPNLALVDSSLVGIQFNESYDWTLEGVTITDSRFDAVEVTVTDPKSGNTTTLTVVGVLRSQLPATTIGGIFIDEQAYRSLIGEPQYRRGYFRLNDGVDAAQAVRGIESALAVQGVEADSVDQIFEDMSATNAAFNRMFQAFMALGLFVGIAGLGVIAFRSVVERRQQIGMLRAIGYQRGIVTLTFLLESSFIAVMGILSGVVGGAILGRNLLTSPDFTEGAEIHFAMPWAEILLVISASFIFSLMMTWWPSKGASRVPVAEALRYE
ncbi:MAG: FtsX-like permease family protein [Dehalococcoidia bacterium]